MNEIEDLRRSLGPAATGYNDAQLRQLSREIDLIAEFLLDLYAIRHPRQRKAKPRDFDIPDSEPLAFEKGRSK